MNSYFFVIEEALYEEITRVYGKNKLVHKKGGLLTENPEFIRVFELEDGRFLMVEGYYNIYEGIDLYKKERAITFVKPVEKTVLVYEEL